MNVLTIKKRFLRKSDIYITVGTSRHPGRDPRPQRPKTSSNNVLTHVFQKNFFVKFLVITSPFLYRFS